MTTPPPDARLGRIAAAGLVLLLFLSVLLVCSVGFGEASRTATRLAAERLAAQGHTLQIPLEQFLEQGLPLEQFPGFSHHATPLLDSDPALGALVVIDATGQLVFSVPQRGQASAVPRQVAPPAATAPGDDYQELPRAGYVQVALELRSKVGTAGWLLVILPQHTITDQIHVRFGPVVALAAALVAGYALLVALVMRRRAPDQRLLRRGYLAAFGLATLAVFAVQVQLSSDGITAQTRALANALAQRVAAPLTLGLALDDFSGLADIFGDYRAHNGDIDQIDLTDQGQILISTDAGRAGQPWRPTPGDYHYTAPLPGAANLAVHVELPWSALAQHLWRSVKNALVLVIATTLLAMLFFTLLQRLAVAGEARLAEAALLLIQPFYFLTVFAEGLTTALLPQHLQRLAHASGVPPDRVSLLVTIYFLAFVAVLIPAGRAAERGGIRRLLLAGGALTGTAALLTALSTSFTPMLPLRALAGAGQGLLLVGVQSYILEHSPPGQKTRGAAIIVFGYNGGMISGSAIGSLLSIQLSVPGVFGVSSALALALVGFVRLLPVGAPRQASTATAGQAGLLHSLRCALRDQQFVLTTLLVGIPSKAILTGVTVFALPLLLEKQLGYQPDDIGQILMLYSGGVLLASTLAARAVDRLGATTQVLTLGMLGSGGGLVLAGLAGWQPVQLHGAGAAALLVGGVALLGLAHGLINAPILSHITTTPTASTLGASTTASLYRLVERVGHIGGPMLVGQALTLTHNQLTTVSGIGLAILVCGLLFVLLPSVVRQPLRSEVSS